MTTSGLMPFGLASRGALALTFLAAAIASSACSSTPAPVTTSASPSCPADTRWDGHGCQAQLSCPAGAELNNGRCMAQLECPAGSWRQAEHCVAPVRCPDGATRRGDRCVAQLSCPEGAARQGDRCVAKLTCPEGAVQKGDRCVGPLSCPPGAELRAGHCMAPAETVTTASLAAADSPKAASINNAILSLKEDRASRNLREAMQLDLFLVSNHPGTRFQLDGYPTGTRTFMLEGGDHVVTFTRPGWPRCRVTLRGTQLGQSITVKDKIAERDPKGCAAITTIDELGRMAH